MDDGIVAEYAHHYVYAASEGEVTKLLSVYYDSIDFWEFKYKFIEEVKDARILGLKE
jgi:hypothetical protein